MTKWPGILMTMAAAVLSASMALAQDPKPEPKAEPPPKLEPGYEAAVNLMKQKLGKDFTVHKVGVFVVAWDLDEAKGAEYEKVIQQVQDALYEHYFTNRPRVVFKIALFKDTASLQKNAKKLAVKSAVMAGGGFYLPYEKVICVDTTMGPWGVQHEETHALLHADFRREEWPASTLSPWIDEGIAMLIESATIKDKDIQVHFDWRLRMVQQLKKEEKLPHLKDVLKMDFATYNSFQNRMVCDAVSRNFLLFLSERQMLKPFYKLYRANYSQDPSGVKFIEQVAKKDMAAVETDWLAWVDEAGTKAAKPAPVPAEEKAP